MSALNVFIPLQKADLAKRQVWGVAAVEQPDHANPPEIMDYARSKPHFLKWSETVQKNSQGKSLGNVRAMHGGQMLAVGRVIHLEPRDAVKAIYIGVEVVDDAAWEKVQKGVYTGFSIGGKYGAKWPDTLTKATRYEAMPNEISLVDLPCIPDAVFEVIKADGGSELRKFSTADETDKPKTDGEQPPADAAAPESDLPDPKTPPENQSPAGDNATPEAETETETPESADRSAEGAEPANEPERLDAEAVKGILISLLMDLGLVQPSGAQPMSMAMMSMPAKIEYLRKSTKAQLGWFVDGKISEHLRSYSENINLQLDTVGEYTKMMFGQIEKSIEAQEDRRNSLQKSLLGNVDDKSAEFQKAIEVYRGQIESQLTELHKTISADIAQVVMAVQTLEKRGGAGPVVKDLGAISPQAMAEMQKAAVLKDLVKDADPATRQALQAEITRLEIKAVQTK